MNAARGVWLRRLLAAAAMATTAAIDAAQAERTMAQASMPQDDSWAYAASDSSGSCDMSDACSSQCQCGDSACGGCAPPWAHWSSIWGELVYLQPTGADMVHAQPQNGIGGAGTVPFGRIGTDDPHYEPGIRVGGNLALTYESSVALSYTFLETDSANTVEPPVIPGGGGAVGSLVHHPGAAITASIGPVDSTYEIDYQLAEAKCRHLLWGDDRGWVNYSAGFRYGHLEQDFAQTGIFAGGAGGEIDTLTDIEFDGGGALFGLDGERLIGCRGLSAYGNVGVSPLFGQFNSNYDMMNVTTDVQLANVQWNDDRVVAILDFEVGVAWTSRSGLWRASSGYMASFWYNTITTAEFVDAVQADNYTDAGDTLSFDGLTARIERRF